MDYLLLAKDSTENVLFERLRNLFSTNARLTFYDITSTFFYSDACSLALNEHSREKRPEPAPKQNYYYAASILSGMSSEMRRAGQSKFASTS